MYPVASFLGKVIGPRSNVARMVVARNEINYCLRCVSNSIIVNSSKKGGGGTILDFPDMGPPIPEYKAKENETIEQKRARLFYQSRKRGMSENGILLSTFASLKLHELDEKLIDQYDKVINKPSNDWELFYWMTEKKPTPEEYDNEIMDMLKYHAKNEKMEMRLHQPPLDEQTTPTASPKQ